MKCMSMYTHPCTRNKGSFLWVENKIISNNSKKPMGKNWFINEMVAFISMLLLET